MRFLVIGATGVAGQSGIAAIRQCFGSEAEVTGVWYGKPDAELTIEGADKTLFGDVASPEFVDELIAVAEKEEFKSSEARKATMDVYSRAHKIYSDILKRSR